MGREGEEEKKREGEERKGDICIVYLIRLSLLYSKTLLQTLLSGPAHHSHNDYDYNSSDY